MAIEPGIRSTPWGVQIYTRIGGRFRAVTYPADTPIATLRSELRTLRAHAQLNLEHRQPADSFPADCRRYLSEVRGMATYTDRAYRIEQWALAFGDKHRHEITPLDISRQLEQWKSEGLSHGSLNLRRTALMHLWSKLDGKSAYNPVRDVPRYPEDPPPLRLPTIPDALKAIQAVTADKSQAKTRARLLVMLWTGLPPAQVMRLDKRDLDLTNSRVYVTARRKGKGSKGRWLPLLPQAVQAFRAFMKAKAWGEFSTSAVYKSLKLGCKKAKVAPFNPYALRHLFLTTAAIVARDDRVVAELAMHSDLRTTRRYTEQSVDPRLTAAIQSMQVALQQPQQPTHQDHAGNGRNLTVAVRRKSPPRNRRKLLKTNGAPETI